MGKRAEKNRLRHGFKTSMIGSGEHGTYTTECPPTPAVHTAGKGTHLRRWYAALKPLTGWQPPKIGRLTKDGKREWAQRHEIKEKKSYGKD